ncbi:MAG TPA: hypothetical protein VMZ52_05455 [Bryobacteraceae bacterium]|nr:hypothetical protein [Bryobacteraceae bacterium]
MRLAFALLTCVTLFAQDRLPRSTPKGTDTGTGVNDPIVDYYDSISDYFRISRQAVMLISKKGIPDQEIPAVLLLPKRAKISPNQVIEARKSGKSWEEVAQQHKVSFPGKDVVSEANIFFLSEYHGRSADEVRTRHAKGVGFVEINQEFRRTGDLPMKRKTDKK